MDIHAIQEAMMRKLAEETPKVIPYNVPPLATEQRPESGLYTVQENDQVGALANKYGVSLRRFMEANPGLNPARLSIGQQLNIPVSDRDWIINDYGFDPEVVAEVSPMHFYQQLMQESMMGKYMTPMGGPAGNTALGWFQMNKPMFDRLKKAHPSELAGMQHADMKDFGKATRARKLAARHFGRQQQYKQLRPMTSEDLVKLWISPSDPNGAVAEDYLKAVTAHKLEDIWKRIDAQPPNIYKMMTGKDKK